MSSSTVIDPATEALWDLIEMRQAQRSNLRTEAIDALLVKAHALATNPDFEHNHASQLEPLLTCLGQLVELNLDSVPTNVSDKGS